MKNIIWTEKYRPKKFEDVIGLPEQLKNQDFDKLPHLLFVGRPGIGKTTCAKIIADMLDAEFRELNASDDRGIQVVREKIKFFAQKASIGRKVLLLDEADYTTAEAQACLRRILEQCANSTLFILTANYLKRIIEPIRSRCTTIEFLNPDKTEIVDKLEYICKLEKVKYDKKDIEFITDVTYPDIRKAINTLQNAVKDGKINVDNVKVGDDILDTVWLILQRKDWKLMRELLQGYVSDYQQIYEYLFDKIFNLDIPRSDKEQALLKLIDRSWRDQNVANPEINFIGCCIDIYRLI